MKLTNPELGDFGLVQSKSHVAWLIRLGQLLNRDASEFNHAFIYIGNNKIIEARASGAVVNSLDEYNGMTKVYSTGRIPLTAQRRLDIAASAHGLVGTPYGWLDYLALALHRFGLKSKLVDRRVSTESRLICSQLVDLAYAKAGVHLFNDGRLPEDVTPGDLAEVLLES